MAERAKTQPGGVRVVRPKAPRVPDIAGPRTETLDKLKDEVGMYAKTVERHDEAIEKWLRPLATQLPAQLSTLRDSITHLDATVKNAASAMSTFATETRERLEEQDTRISDVEDRHAKHETRWTLLEAENLPPRVAALEERRAVEDTTAKVDAALVAQQRKYTGFLMRHLWKGIAILQSAALAYLGLS